ncbi:MAG: sensor histidine kinase [Hyphomicrobiaceae bacterium]|nr:sensor histidine kinase [Hyphomicrobiaceae bacterium]
MRAIAAGIALVIAFAVALWLTGDVTRKRALDDLAERSGHVLNLVSESLRGELAKHQSTPFLIAHNPEMARVVTGAAAPEEVLRANEALARWAKATDALDIYLLNSAGTTVATSNFAGARSFIGQNFSYRPYFTEAMKGRLGRYFAVGTTSGERGYYFANPIFDGRYVVGTAVVKLQVGHLEEAWRTTDHDIVVVDEDGIVFLSSDPTRRLRSLAPLSDEARDRITTQRRYDGAPLAPLDITTRTELPGGKALVTLRGTPDATASERRGREYLMQSRTMSDAGWTVMILARTDGVASYVFEAVAFAAITLTALLLAAANIHLRRRRLYERMQMQESAKVELERRVAERTDELVRAQSELVQASKLAALGQMSAGLSHELNQPLAAIRSYSDNARVFLERGRNDIVVSNLSAIGELTQRMARIIRHLRTYARKEPTTMGPTLVAKSIDEAVGLLQRRFDDGGIVLSVDLPSRGLTVIGGEVRLQQVFVNLISNAIDAMRDSQRREIAIVGRETNGRVIVSVTDSGPGIAPEHLASVFDPFFTTKDVGAGLGLGLSITYGIVKQFGGSINARNADGGGARFEIELTSARTALENAA